MRLYFLSPESTEDWDYRNVYDVGIGGSQTWHVECALRMARRSYEVVSYSPLPPDCPNHNFGGVRWEHFKDADYSQDGLWIFSRCFPFLDAFAPTQRRRAWMVCQDVDYAHWTPARGAKLTTIFGLCPDHVAHLKCRHPQDADRIVLSGNGIATDQLQQLPSDVPRNPKRLMFSSSPDRGLDNLLEIFTRAREQDEELELHIFYGLNNLENFCRQNSKLQPAVHPMFELAERAKNMPGVTWHGRIGQQLLRIEWLKSGIWCHPSNFAETSSVTCMESQALGAYPITNPIWGIAHNVEHGIFIQGDPAEPPIRDLYVENLLLVASHPGEQERRRRPMMQDALARHDWENICEQYERLLAHQMRPALE